jgi:hypothetical protein
MLNPLNHIVKIIPSLNELIIIINKESNRIEKRAELIQCFTISSIQNTHPIKVNYKCIATR